jgi:hydrogenase expression/formation protein HypC
MCLAVPAKIVALEGDEANVDFQGTCVRVSTLLVPDVEIGDWVLVHAGFIIQRLDPEAARRTWSVLSSVTEL